MKKLFFLAAFVLIGTFAAVAQNPTSVDYERQGKTFVQKTDSAKGSSDVPTGYVWKDSKGAERQIHITKNGRCYVWTTSKKGNDYKKYLQKEICLEICNELGVEYKEK